MADEIWLDVLPSLKNFGSKMIQGVTGTARNAGQEAGKAFDKGFESGTKGAAQKEVQRLEAAQKSAAGLVSKLSGDVSRARQRQQKAAADLITAEQRLADATAKYGSESSQAQAAALRLEAARAKAADTDADYKNKVEALKEAQDAGKITAEQLEKAQKDLNAENRRGSSVWDKLKRSVGDTDAAASRTKKTLDRLKSGAKLVGKGFLIAGGAVAGFAATLVGMAVKGGIDRALNIEDARASLTGLGHDTKAVDKIMQSALASVKGTAFGLGDAATIAATAVAAGIKPGEDLTRTLKLTANTAALARVGLDEMGSILNKVWTAGRVSTEELNQLADRGIPIWTKLAEKYKVNGTELRKMVADGKVDAETFASVLTTTVGTAADEMGKTTRGMWANFKAALGRGGEVLMGPFLDAFKDGLGKAIPLIDSFTESLKPIMEDVAARLPGAMQALTDGLAQVWDVLANRVIPALQEGVRWFQENKAWVVPLTLAVLAGAAAWKLYDMAQGGYVLVAKTVKKALEGQTVAQWALNAAMKANPIGILIGVIVGLVAAFVYLWKTNEGFRNFFIGAWEAIKGAVSGAWDFISGVFGGMVSGVKDGLGPVFTWFRDSIITPVWGFIRSTIDTAAGAIQSALGGIGNFVTAVFGPVFKWLYDVIIKPIWGLIKWQIEFVSNVVLLAFDLMVYFVKNVLGPAFKWFYTAVIQPVWNGVQKAISFAWSVVSAIFTTIVGAVRNSLGAAFVFLRDGIITPVWNAFQRTIAIAWTGVKTIFGGIVGFVRATLGPIFTWFRDTIITPVWNGIGTLINNVWNRTIRPVFIILSTFIKDVVAPGFKKGVDAIGKAWDVLKKAAGTPVYFVLETIYNQGIKKTFDKVAKAVGSKASLPAAKTSGIPHFAKGGEMRDGWKLVGEEGPEIIHTGPGYVYTARETKKMLAGHTQAPLGALDSLRDTGQIGEAEHKGIGGFGETVFSGIKNVVAWTGDKLKKGLDWVRGGLAKAAEFVLNPLKNLVSSKVKGKGFFGDTVGQIANNAVNSVLDWIRGKDEEWEAAGGEFGGGFTGANGGFYRPVGGTITSLFGSSRGRYPHAGTDLAVPVGTAVRAAWNGVVKKAGWNIVTGRSGIGMLLAHSGGKNTYYGHLSKALLKPGTEVKAGQVIAKSGNTGRSTGPHLHFETWQNGKPYNNIGLLRGGSGGGKKKALYDEGGILPPGITLAENKTGGNEYIYTKAQNRALQTLAARGAESIGMPDYVTLVVDGHEFRGYVKDAAGERMVEAKKQARQGNRQRAGTRGN